MSDPDFSEFSSDGPTAEDTRALGVLARELLEAERIEADATEALNAAKERVKTLRDHDIPALMERAGFDDGTKLVIDDHEIVINTKYGASIPKARHEEAMQWLERNGHAGLIKVDVVASFGRGEKETADQLAAKLGEEHANVKETEGVHSSTLRGFVREQAEAGDPVPEDLFGVHVMRSAKVKRR